MKTKTFTFGVSWQMFGKTQTEVPAHFTEEEATEYVREKWNEIVTKNGLPSGEYVLDSDAPCFDVHCDFECS